MTPYQKRILLFLTGCVGTRLAFVYIAKYATQSVLKVLGAMALLPAVGFLYIYLSGARKTGAEVFGDRIWWNNLRPFHGGMYATFAILALSGNSQAWIVLLLDLLVGLTAFAIHYISAIL